MRELLLGSIAGDTAIAAFTSPWARAAATEHAARLAKCAGGIVVLKRRMATVAFDELREVVRKDLSL